MKLSCFRTCTFCSIFFCQVLRIAVQSLFLCLSVRRLMMWYICRCLKSVCLSLLLFNSAGESHSTGGLWKSKFKSICGGIFKSWRCVMMIVCTLQTHTYARRSVGVCTCLLWSMWWFPARTFVILFQGHGLHFRRCRGVGVVRGPQPPRPPCPPFLPNTISQALTSRSAAVCFKASN